ncbi:MAG TPA: glycosyltransferase family 39 protein [Chitinophagales bacterium]|nr:glycosyltransferase family 39 protein [Chitinophagales bacterium]
MGLRNSLRHPPVGGIAKPPGPEAAKTGTVPQKIPLPFLLITAIAALLWLPHLLALGMFMDGVYDAVFAKNIYTGAATFWVQQSINYTDPQSWGTPPLGAWLLAQWLKVFGDHYQVERAYSLACGLVQLGLIAILWRTIFTNNGKLKQQAWLPCMLWLISPLTGWCYSNNLLENTMALFTTAAIIIIVWYVQQQRQMLLSSVAVAALLLMAAITKGPVALFPLILPVLLVGVNNKYDFKQGVLFSILQVAFFASLFAILFSFPEPKVFLQHYLDVQLKRALTHDMPGQYRPYQILIELLMAALPFIALALIKYLMRKKLYTLSLLPSVSRRFLLLGVCGSLPIALSIKQRRFYLLPAMVPVVIGFAAYLVPLWDYAYEKATSKTRQIISQFIQWGSIAAIAVSIALCVYNYGRPYRDISLLADLQQLNQLAKNETAIRADWGFYDQWALRGYLLRLYDTKLCMPNEPAPAHYYLTHPNQRGDQLPANAVKIFSGANFDVYSY